MKVSVDTLINWNFFFCGDVFSTGTSNSNGWSTWPSWTTWRSRPTWTSRSTRCTNGSIQPRTLQPGTSRSSVSRHFMFLNSKTLSKCQIYVTGCLFFLLLVAHLLLTSLRDGVMATHTGNRDSPIQVGTYY